MDEVLLERIRYLAKGYYWISHSKHFKRSGCFRLKIKDMNFKGAVIGDNAIIRANTTVYTDVTNWKKLPHRNNVMIREETSIGDDVLNWYEYDP